MNNHIQLGKYNKLKVYGDTPYGLVLVAIDGEEVLLPNRYTDGLKIDDEVEVFIYADSEDRLVATTDRPLLSVGEFGYVDVVDITKFGIFVDIGLSKDILIPKAKQRTTLRVGDKVVVKLIEDNSARLIATQKFNSGFLNNHIQKGEFYKNKEVNLFVYEKTDLGYKVVVDGYYDGLVYKDEVFQSLSIGDKLKGYVKLVRHDRKLDISLQKIGKKRNNFSDIVYDKIKSNGNFMPLNYKSDAQLIYDNFGISKKNFKQALTTLKDNQKIDIDPDGISII
jgi:predicted RNA-binding protein (virulence factor B family)